MNFEKPSRSGCSALSSRRLLLACISAALIYFLGYEYVHPMGDKRGKSDTVTTHSCLQSSNDTLEQRSKLVVYTAIFRTWSTLRKQPQEKGVDYICFTDRKDFVKEGGNVINGWRIVFIDGLRVLNRTMIEEHIKLLPHLYLNANISRSLYVDGDLDLEFKPSRVFHTLLPPEAQYNFGYCVSDKGNTLETNSLLARKHTPEMEDFSMFLWNQCVQYTRNSQDCVARLGWKELYMLSDIHQRAVQCGRPRKSIVRGRQTVYEQSHSENTHSVTVKGKLCSSGEELKKISLISTVSVAFDGDMLSSFVSYYMDVLQIPASNFYIFLQYNPETEISNCQELKKLLTIRGIDPIPYPFKYSSPSRLKFYLLLLRQLGPNRWVLHADADELHGFPPLNQQFKQPAKSAELFEHEKLKHLIQGMERGGYNFFKTIWEDRIAYGHELLSAPSQFNVSKLFFRFPCYMPRKGLKGYNFKVALYRSYLTPVSSGHHYVRYTLTRDKKAAGFARETKYPQEGITFHFKWRASVKVKLREREQQYKQLGLHIWRESQNNLHTLEHSLANNKCFRPRYTLSGLGLVREL